MRELRDRLHRKTRTTARQRFWPSVDRDTYECPMCGRTESDVGVSFHVHHRDGDHLNNHPINLIALCPRCHSRIHQMAVRSKALTEWKRGFLALGDKTNRVSHGALYSDD